VATQLQKQRTQEEEFMKQPFQPEVVVAAGAAAPATPAVAQGQNIFSQSCNACHGEAGVGGGIGPRLVGVGKKYDAAKIASLLKTPTPAMTAGGMPPVDLKPEELDALIAYLQSLQ
jgi:mono/diheme cytochrome c family protein